MNATASAGIGRKSNWAENALILPWTLLTAYWAMTYSGPYLWVSEWQQRHFGHYYLVLSFGLPMLVGWGATVLLLRPILRRADTPSGRAESLTQALHAFAKSPAIPLLVFVAGVGVALHMRAEALSYGPLRAVTPAFLSADPGKDRYLEMTGVADGRTVVRGESGDEDLFFGMHEKDADPAAAAPVFVAITRRDVARELVRNMDGTVTVRGVIKRGMDAGVRHYFVQQGVAVAEKPWVLQAGRSPASEEKSVPFIVGISALLAVAAWFRLRSL
jgi:hypothetical protein